MADVLSLRSKATVILGVRALLLAALFLMPGCTDPLVLENDKLREEIIRVHDEAMARIGLLYELQILLKDQSENHTGDDSGTETAELIRMLQQADEAMFAWMRQYRTLAVDNDRRKDTRYRREQLEQIKEVQRLMEDAARQAQVFLNRQD